MMWDLKPPRILVAVEDTECSAVLAYAARESQLRGVGVHLVHVAPVAFGGHASGQSLALINGELHELSRMILAETAKQLETLIGDHDSRPVTTEVVHGTVIQTIVEESRHAALVVLQHRGMGPDGRAPVLSVTSHVAARAHAPVVAVPSGWTAPGPDGRPVVTVWLADDEDVDGRLVDVATEEAMRTRAVLRIVRTDDSEHGQHLPDTTLYVVGRRHAHLPLGHHLSREVRDLLRRSPVPVLVVNPAEKPKERRDLSSIAVP